MTSSFKPAARAGVGLLIGIAGETGSGKTFSALRLARGLAGRDDAAIAFIDTEAGRALHYAPAAGEKPGPSTFGFSHCDLTAPFTPERYLEKITEADAAGFRVIVIDSFSHEWDGEGGCQDIHDEDLDAMVERSRVKNGGEKWWDEATQREKLSITAWKGAKLRHKRMVSRLLQARAHLVICMRAEDKLRIESKTEQGRNGREYTKTEVIQAAKLPPRERWQPICEKRFPFQLITSLVVTPDRPGVPIALKLQEQHRAAISETRPLDERSGEALAAWARGETKQESDAPRRLETPAPEALMQTDDWRVWSKTLAGLIDASTCKRAWLEANVQTLLRLRAAHPTWAAALEAKASAAVPPAADEGAPAHGVGAGASSLEQGEAA